MVLPDSEKNITDVLDFLTDACTTIEERENPNTGEIEYIQKLDHKKAGYKMQMVNSPYFSNFVKELEDFSNMADQCFQHMSKERALVLSRQIKAYCRSFDLSIDAKSSETLRNQHNTQGALVHELLKQKVERAYTLKGDLKKSFWSGLTGRDGQEEAANG